MQREREGGRREGILHTHTHTHTHKDNWSQEGTINPCMWFTVNVAIIDKAWPFEAAIYNYIKPGYIYNYKTRMFLNVLQ